MHMRYRIIVGVCAVVGCHSTHSTQDRSQGAFLYVSQLTPRQQAYVYKTRGDYAHHLPVILNDERTAVVSYPDPRDVRTSAGFTLPTRLSKGYLLDKRGINKNVAFLKVTYEEYSQLAQLPTTDELYALILDKDPLLELCDCGEKLGVNAAAEQINKLIHADSLRIRCKVLK